MLHAPSGPHTIPFQGALVGCHALEIYADCLSLGAPVFENNYSEMLAFETTRQQADPTIFRVLIDTGATPIDVGRIEANTKGKSKTGKGKGNKNIACWFCEGLSQELGQRQGRREEPKGQGQDQERQDEGQSLKNPLGGSLARFKSQ